MSDGFRGSGKHSLQRRDTLTLGGVSRVVKDRGSLT